MKWTVAKKLWTGFASIIVLLIVVGSLGLWASVSLNSKYEDLLENNVEKVQMIDEFILKQKEIQGEVRGYILFKDTAYLKSLKEYIDRSTQLIGQLEKDFQGSLTDEVEKLKEANGKFMTLQNDIVANLEAGKERKAVELGRASSNVSAIVLENAEVIKTNQVAAMKDARAELTQYMNGIIYFITGLIIIAIVAGIIISTAIARRISRPVQIVTDSLNAIANGDFTIERLQVKNNDEIGTMAEAFNKMGTDIAQMIRKINMSVLRLASQSEQLSASAEESLASSEMVAKTAEQQLLGSEQQQHIIEQSATSMNELSLGVAEIATSNEEMLHSAESVISLVSHGSAVVEDVSQQMATIHATIKESTEIMEEMARNSNEIQKVTSLITAIAEQTNLLALNAAIEAARAGEYGKGFAVVADEVRHLAEQSKSSAAEIEAMVNMIQQASTKAVTSITSGSERVDAGITATTQSREVFADIQQAVGDVSSKVQTVSAAIEQIQAMADEVSHGAYTVRQLSAQAAEAASDTSAATEEQLAVNEEITSSAVELATLAEELQAEVRKFKV